MLNEVRDGIIRALKDAFPEIPVYDENVEQDLPIPSFSVRAIRSTQSLFRGARYWKTNDFNVVYFPPEDDRNTDCNAVQEALFSCLEYIQAGSDLVRGTGMDGHVEDGVLSFAVSYNYFANLVEPDRQTMDELKVEVKLDEQETD